MGRRVTNPPPTSECRLAVRCTICGACGDPLYVLIKLNARFVD